MEEKLGFVDTAWMVITENLELSMSSMDVIGMVVQHIFQIERRFTNKAVRRWDNCMLTPTT